MIKEWVARAMQIACIEDEEIIQKLHKRERLLNMTIPNYGIQEVLRIPTIKEKHGIPKDDLEAQEFHQERIERELIEKGIRFDRHPKENCDYVDDMHSMDWKVFKNKDLIKWEYSGGGNGKRGGIMKRLENNFMLFL